MKNQTITAIPGILVGHATNREAGTGCTAVLCPEGFSAGVHVPGFATGSREIELLRPESLTEAVHGLALSGGSAFGLRAADGVVRFLREKGHGFVMPHALIPLVSGAVIYDLDVNAKAGELPDEGMGYSAAAGATDAPVEQGGVGAGTGARCGRMSLFAGDAAFTTDKSGVGSALVERDGVLVGALAVVNALGNVHDPDNGRFLAGARDGGGRPINGEAVFSLLAGEAAPSANTVLAVVAANMPLNKVQVCRLARMACARLPRAIRPAHLLYDGDIVFSLAPRPEASGRHGFRNESLLGAMGAEALARATANAVLHA